MVKLSVIIITFNEEKNIGRCLESVKNIADEIVVLDSYSKDKTKEICESYHVRFFEHEFDGHIEQKNRAIELAANEHILSLDADEALSGELNKSILEILDLWDADAYSFNRLTNYCGKWIYHSGWYPDRKVRLFRKNNARWGGVNPHDRIILDKQAITKHLKGDLLHYSYYTIDQHVDQINKFSSIKAKEMYKRGKKFNIFLALFSPLVKFIKQFILQRGFLDGIYGLTITINSSQVNFLKYMKLRELNKKK